MIQHRGARTGLITTDGFRDLLEIGRQKRPDLYDIRAEKPVLLVSRDLRLEVTSRPLWNLVPMRVDAQSGHRNILG